MKLARIALPALLLAAVAAGGLGADLPFAQAQSEAQHGGDADHHHHGRMGEHFVPGRHIEGRIAFLKTELKITDAQAPQWEKVAAAMRENAAERRQAFEQMHHDHDKPRSAVEMLEMRARLGEFRSKQTQRFLAAFKPLYESFSPEQKQTADELLARAAEHHHHGR